MWGHARRESTPAELASRVGLDAERGRGRLRRDRAPAGRRPSTCTRLPSSPTPSRRMCGIAGIVRPARRPGFEEALCCGWPGHSATAGPTASGSRSTRAPGSHHAARDLRPPARLAADRRPPGQRHRLQRRGLQPPGTARELERPRRDVLERPATPRSSSDCWSGTALAALDRLNGQFAFAWWQPRHRRLTLVRDRFGVRPLYYALLPDGTLGLRLRGEGYLRLGRGASRARSARHRRRLHPLGRRAAADASFAGIQQVPAGRPRRLGAGRIVDERRWWRPSYRLATPTRRRPRGPAARQRPPAAARRRPGRDISVRRTRLEPPHRARAGRRPSTSCALSRSRSRPPVRRARPPGAGRARHRHPTPRRRGRAERDRDGLPRRCASRRDAAVRTRRCRSSCLAREVRARDITVVATGEGADELFWGYDLFKEVALRDLALRDPERARDLSTSSTATSRRQARRARLGPFMLETGATTTRWART